MDTSPRPLHTLFLLAALASSFAVTGCDKSSADKSEKTEKSEKPAKPGADEAKAPAEEPPAEKVVELTLAKRDITEEVKKFFPDFKGTKAEMLLPEGVKFEESPGMGFSVVLDNKVFALDIGLIHETAKVVAGIEAGESLLDGAKITEKGEGYVIQQGKYFGEEGHSLNVDLEPIGTLKSGCRTPTGRLYSEAHIRKALEACQSFTVTK